MQKTLLVKALIVFGLMLIIGLPLLMIQETIKERMEFRQEAVNSIAADSVREQTIIGPILVIPYTEQYEERVEVAKGDDKEAKSAVRTELLRRTVQRRLLVYPNNLLLNGNIETDRRYRGIHQVLVYSGQHAFKGDFTVPAGSQLPRKSPDSRVTLGAPFVALSIEDVRGIRNIPKIDWGGQKIEFEQGTDLFAFRSGLHAPLGAMSLAAPQQISFAFELGLDGIERQHFVPVAKNSQISIKSNWPHPQFGGRFLPSPKFRQINADGFQVEWSISSLATNAQTQLSTIEGEFKVPDSAPLGQIDRFSVGFIEPVNVYSQSDRATKYGLLFVALTFAAFFIFEILKSLPIHPVQYLLVGLSLAIFFLLLVGLAEHIAFLTAYLIASAACIALTSFYLVHVLHNAWRGIGFGVGLTMLYGALYGLLSSENNALVMGSILLFAVLAAIMMATRKVDWYQVGRGGQ
ncbi:cell envelope integrity protein CreD [Janthinobacterium sp. GW460P]|uniref:cell envelope integrity protein CreD n=1 Tax=unclassified Janthinobacterium TaxID=2610881 RepID=UPI000A325ADB|nr:MULTISPECIES: cell envelope integrity protein CreD [unclassified Janthinobacterium]MCC7704120.1 cell envelope integrity protein CreD [Janthinobacterium sp. GW460P]MCC7709828.1 cell envelope integrity protein CreD [Janthinobacterium sp. GW460W]